MKMTNKIDQINYKIKFIILYFFLIYWTLIYFYFICEHNLKNNEWLSW